MRIAVLFGGTSSERDVSVASAAQVVRSLERRGHVVVPVDCEVGVLSAEQAHTLLSQGIAPMPPTVGAERRIATAKLAASSELLTADVAFLALHGGQGEDGTVQALLDLLGIPFTGSDLRASSLAWDKDLSKRLFRTAGIPTAEWLMAPVSTQQAADEIGLPLIVKPNREGSTVGLTVVRELGQLQSAIEHAQRYDREVMIERFIAGRELTVGVLGGEPLCVGEIFPLKGAIFDYESKYQPGGAKEVFPAELPAALTAELQQHALAVHAALKLGDYCRVDFRLDEQQRPWVLEVNTLPGMSAMSLMPQSARAAGLSFDDLCERICQLALAR